MRRRPYAHFSSFGACGPQAVKAEPAGKTAGRVVGLAALGLRPAPPRVFGLDRQPPLIGAGLVGCMRNRQASAMSKPDTIIIDGHALSWQRLFELRRQQVGAWKAGQCRQLALFELKDDRRPAAEQTAAGRYSEPTLFALMAERD
jgi:hypothetical protein